MKFFTCESIVHFLGVSSSSRHSRQKIYGDNIKAILIYLGVKRPSWIFCVKRHYAFCFQKLCFFQTKLLQPLQKIRSNLTMLCIVSSRLYKHKIKRGLGINPILFLFGREETRTPMPKAPDPKSGASTNFATRP